MADLKVKILSADRVVLETEANAVVAWMPDGEFSVLPGHINAVMPLEIEEVRLIGTPKGDVMVAVHRGLMETTPESVLILGEAAELPNEIDIKRAEEAKARAEKRLQQAKAGKKDVDVVRAEAALKRALLRLRLAQKAQSR